MKLNFKWKTGAHGYFLYVNGMRVGAVGTNIFRAKGDLGNEIVYNSLLPSMPKCYFGTIEKAKSYAQSATREWFRDCLGGAL